MSTKSFSNSVLSQFQDTLVAVKTQFKEAERAKESARKAAIALTRKMTKLEVNLPKAEKDQVRSGPKNLNKTTFNQFVVDFLSRCQSEKHVDEIVTAAVNCGFVSTNKDGIRSSVTRALSDMSNTRGSGVKSLGNGFYSA